MLYQTYFKMLPQLPLLLTAFLLLLLPNISSVASVDPNVTFTANVTSVQPGQPFTARCQVAGYEVKGNEHLSFLFYRKNSTYNEWFIDYHYDADGSGQRHWSIEQDKANHADLAIDLHPSITYPACEVSMRMTRVADYEYYCSFTSRSLPKDYYSNDVTVSVRPPSPPNVTFTTNVTSVQPGQPFTVRCQVAGYEVNGNEYLAFIFSRKNSTFDGWFIEYHYDVNSSGQRQWSIWANYSNHPDLAIDLRPSTTYPACEMSMHPTRLADYEYYCGFTSNSIGWVYSNHVTVSVHPPPPHLTLSSNVSNVQVGQPFSLSCQLDGLERASSRNYSVQFRDTNTLLATYDVFAPKSGGHEPLVVFKETELDNTLVTLGGHFAYPTFEVTLNTRTERNQFYWCSLLDDTKQEYKSNIWPTPAVTFSANVSGHHDGVPFAGRCSVAKFPSADTVYSVGFFAAQTGLLATYIVQPHKPIELIIKGHHPNILITEGDSLQLPVYELLINFTGPSQAFWCALQIGQHAEAREFKSNEVTL